MNKENVLELKELMLKAAELEAVIKDMRDVFENSIRSKKEESTKARLQTEQARKVVRLEAEEEFKTTGSKQLLGGVKIQCKKVTTYNEQEALRWAKRKDMFLALDKKAFDKAAPGLGLDFVTTEEAVKVTFPKEIKIEEE